jgi:tetratricopeptide (TPR) repeat protein
MSLRFGLGHVAGYAALLLLVVGMMSVTISRHASWRDDLALWSDAVAKTPASGYARHNLAIELDRQGRTAEGVELLRDGLRRYPDDLETAVTLGEFSFNLGDLPTAARMFEIAVGRDRADPSVLARAYYGLGLVRYNRGAIESARHAWETAVRLNPAHVEAAAALRRVTGP